MVKINRSYGLDRGLTDVFPRPVIASRAPTTADKNHPIGRGWVRTSTNQSWILTSVVSGSATWSLASPGASDVDTLTGDAGGAISPAGGNITLAGGTNLASSGGGSTITFNLDAAITLATSVTSPIYTSAAGMAITAAAANDITIKMGDAVGAQKISFTDSADAEQASLDSDGTLTVVNMDGIIGATTPAAIIGTTITAGTSVVSPIFTSTGAVDTNINAVAGQDIIVKLGDIAAANKLSIIDSGSIEVASIDSNGALVAAIGITSTAGNITATLGNLVATNGNLTLGTAGNKLNITTGANASVGSGTLVGGTLTIATTAVTASSIVVLTRQSVGSTGAAALGILSVGTIIAATSFVIEAWQVADATALQASDVSEIGWMIIN